MYTSLDIQINRLKWLLKKSSSVLILGHRHPDGDTVGSALALKSLLSHWGKAGYYLSYDSVPANLNFLIKNQKIICGPRPRIPKFNQLIVLDSSSPKRTGLEKIISPDIFSQAINIDHHQDNENFCKINLVDPKASSTAEIIYRIISKIGSNVNKFQATCLLTGIVTDTDSFRNTNTKIKTFEITSSLLSAGANLPKIARHTLQEKSISVLKLWGRVLTRLKKNYNLGILTTVVTQNDLKEFNAKLEDLEGLTNFLNSVANVKATLVISEGRGEIKGSLRTLMNKVDVAKLAAAFGGGGHKKAAGFSIPGKLKKDGQDWTIVQST